MPGKIAYGLEVVSTILLDICESKIHDLKAVNLNETAGLSIKKGFVQTNQSEEPLKILTLESCYRNQFTVKIQERLLTEIIIDCVKELCKEHENLSMLIE